MKYLSFINRFLISVFVLKCVLSGNCLSIEEDLTITPEQKIILEKFRGLVDKRLPHDYMRKDVYLIRWLRAKEFDILAAEQMLLRNLEWREKNGMDSIVEKDFSDIEVYGKYQVEDFELEKRAGYIAIADVDARKGALLGLSDRFVKYLDKCMEDLTSRVRVNQDKGLNITRYNFVVNAAGFNVIQHSCLACVSSLIRFILSYENHYPALCGKFYVVNAPGTFNILYNAVKGVLSPSTREGIRIYGTNKAEWQSILFKDIPPAYLPIDIGGEKYYE